MAHTHGILIKTLGFLLVEKNGMFLHVTGICILSNFQDDNLQYYVSRWFCNEPLDKLSKCKEEVESLCDFPVDQAKLDKYDQCFKDAKAFSEAVSNCSSNGNKEDEQACDCFGKLDLEDLLTKMNKCKPREDDDLVTQEKKKCRNSKYSNSMFHSKFSMSLFRNKWM